MVILPAPSPGSSLSPFLPRLLSFSRLLHFLFLLIPGKKGDVSIDSDLVHI